MFIRARARLLADLDRDPSPQRTWSDDFMAFAADLDAPVAQLENHLDRILDEGVGLSADERLEAMAALASRPEGRRLFESHYDPERARELIDQINADAQPCGCKSLDELQAEAAEKDDPKRVPAADAADERHVEPAPAKALPETVHEPAQAPAPDVRAPEQAAPARAPEVAPEPVIELAAAEAPTPEKRRESEPVLPAALAAKSDAAAPAPGSDDDLKARVESARAEMGRISEKPYRHVPELIRDAKTRQQFADKLAASGRSIYFAADAYSLECLRRYAKEVSLGDYDTLAIKGGFQWCGSFVADHYQLTARIIRENGAVATNASLASDTKSKAMFQYSGSWKNARILDRQAAADAPLEDRYQPLRDYHAAHGGERQWLPYASWADDPAAVLKPGMMLFIVMKDRPADHLVMVDRVEGGPDWVIHTLEGNAGDAMTLAGTYRRGDRELDGAARPAPLDFDPSVEMVDATTFERMKKDEAHHAARQKSQRTARAM